MKNTIVLLICILAIATAVSCGDQSSGSSSTAFKIQPGDVTSITPNLEDNGKGTTFNVNFNGKDHYMNFPYSAEKYAYAIIFQKNINGADYVGITFGEDPKSNRKFKVYIYFPSINIPNSYSGDATIIVINDQPNEEGKRYSYTGSVNITITNNNPLYTVSMSNIDFGSGKILTISSLTAYLVQ